MQIVTSHFLAFSSVQHKQSGLQPTRTTPAQSPHWPSWQMQHSIQTWRKKHHPNTLPSEQKKFMQRSDQLDISVFWRIKWSSEHLFNFLLWSLLLLLGVWDGGGGGAGSGSGLRWWTWWSWGIWFEVMKVVVVLEVLVMVETVVMLPRVGASEASMIGQPLTPFQWAVEGVGVSVWCSVCKRFVLYSILTDL